MVSVSFGTAFGFAVAPVIEGVSAANIGPLGDFVVPVVEDGRQYIVEVALIGADGQTAMPVEFFHQVQGKTARPGVVTNGSINAHGEISTLRWTPPSDIDISHYQIRHSSATVNANYSNSVTLVASVSRPATSVQVPTRNGTYFIRSYDKSGNASDGVEAVILLDDAAFLRGYNVVETLAEHPAFSGTKNNVVRETANNVNFLRLVDAGTPDDSVVESGTYEFGPIDLGQKFHCRVAPLIDVIRLGLGDVDLFDERQGLFDAQVGNFDGAQSVLEEIDAQFSISVTDDDPSGSPVWGPWEQLDISNYQFRAARLDLP